MIPTMGYSSCVYDTNHGLFVLCVWYQPWAIRVVWMIPTMGYSCCVYDTTHGLFVWWVWYQPWAILGSPSGLGERVVPPGQLVATYDRQGNHMDSVNCSFFGKLVYYLLFALSIPLVVFHSLQVSHYHGTAVAMSHNINNCGSYRNGSYSSFNTYCNSFLSFLTCVTNWK